MAFHKTHMDRRMRHNNHMAHREGHISQIQKQDAKVGDQFQALYQAFQIAIIKVK